MNRILLSIIILIGIFIGTFLIGMLLPNPRITTNEFSVSAPIDKVWDQITDHKNQETWRKGLKEVLVDNENPNQWTEISLSGSPITFKVSESLKNQKYRIDIVPTHGFQGHSTIEFREDGENTQLIFTEASISSNPFFRILNYLFYQPKKFIKIYEEELKNSLET